MKTPKDENRFSTLTVGNNEYRWAVRHSWLVDSGAGLKGLSFSVCLNPGRTRELVIDCPFSTFGLNRDPKRSELVAVLRSAIQDAIDAGWEPESRGHTFRYRMPDTQEAK